jgi:hypothetical protein
MDEFDVVYPACVDFYTEELASPRSTAAAGASTAPGSSS